VVQVVHISEDDMKEIDRKPLDGYWYGPARAIPPGKAFPMREFLAYKVAVKAREKLKPPKGSVYTFDGRHSVGVEQEVAALKALRAAVLRMP
jgi:hypothetical protein